MPLGPDFIPNLAQHVAQIQHICIDFYHTSRQSVAQIQRLLYLFCSDCCKDAATPADRDETYRGREALYSFIYKD